MNSILYLGMDVHKESYTVCIYEMESDSVRYQQKMSADYRNILKYVDRIRLTYGKGYDVICGYEAGCLGYSLYHQLTSHGINCVILAPSTMAITSANRVKTDKRDAAAIARCLAFRTYREVYVPTKQDEAVKEFIRMRDTNKETLKRVKKQILSYVLRLGFNFDGKSYWTIKHMNWLKSLEMDSLFRETLDEYMLTYEQLTDKIERLDARIEEIAEEDEYCENVGKLKCFMGIKTHTALSFIVETGDFNRFEKPGKYSAFLGLVPGEDSSGDKRQGLPLTKTGNRHLRTLIVEAAQCYSRGQIGHKSKELKKRQQGNSSQVIAYADKANERLRRRYYKMTLGKGKNANIAKAAIARELSCFIWGMMTENIA